MIRFVRLLSRLPVGDLARRALDEVAADWHFEARRARGPAARLALLAAALLAVVRLSCSSLGSFEAGPMRNLGRDLHHAWRRLFGAPAFTVFAVASLALAIGATTAVFSLIDAVVFRPVFPYDVDRIVTLYHSPPPGSGPMISVSWPDYEDLRAQQDVFSRLAAWRRVRPAVALPDRTEPALGEQVTGEYFAIFGIAPVAGRLLQPEDGRPDAPNVVVLSERSWELWFDRSPDAIGSTLRLDGTPYQVVGVAEAAFRGVDMPNVHPTPFWVPLRPSDLDVPGRSTSPTTIDREARVLRLKARLAPGRTVADARAQVRTIAARLDEAAPIGDPASGGRSYRDRRDWAVVPASQFHVHETVDRIAVPAALAALGAAVLVLLVSCTNLANLVLAHQFARRHEAAVRMALGASRWRLVRETLVETGLVVAAGGLLASLLARALMVWTTGGLPAAPGLTLHVAPVFDVRAAAAALAAALLTLAVFGVIPALRASRVDVRAALGQGDAARGTVRWRGRRILLGAQVAVSTTLVTIALLAAGEARRAVAQDPGYELDRVATAGLVFDEARLSPAAIREAQQRLLDRARLLPGQTGTALASRLPIDFDSRFVTFGDAEGPRATRPTRVARLMAVTPDAHDVLGIAITEGRGFRDTDAAGTTPVAIVSRRLADELFDGAPPLGRAAVFHLPPSASQPAPPAQTVTVVGVADDTDIGSVGQRRTGAIYLPLAQFPEGPTVLLARAPTDAGAAALVGALRRAAAEAAPDLAVNQAGTARQLAGADGLAPRILARIAGLLGALACVLALAGLYGVLSQIVRHRRREMGLRMALGASARGLAALVLRQGLSPVVAGLVAGLAAGLAGRQLLGVFFRVAPALDLPSLALVPALLLAAGVVACWVPARRAARVDPNVALRDL